MAAVLRVMTPAGYNKVMDEWDIGNKSPVQIGQGVYKAQCATCHSVDGTANSGPTWFNLYGNEQPLADGSTIVADENYIRESILYPGRKIHAGYANVMPQFQGLLSDQQIDGIIAYMRTISDKGGPAEGEGEGEGQTDGADPEAGSESETEADSEQSSDDSTGTTSGAMDSGDGGEQTPSTPG